MPDPTFPIANIPQNSHHAMCAEVYNVTAETHFFFS
jgi:hypothetical protein